MNTSMRSFAVEVIADKSGQWRGDSLRFASPPEAKAYALDWARRWTSVTAFRVIESSGDVNAHFAEGELLRIGGPE